MQYAIPQIAKEPGIAFGKPSRIRLS